MYLEIVGIATIIMYFMLIIKTKMFHEVIQDLKDEFEEPKINLGLVFTLITILIFYTIIGFIPGINLFVFGLTVGYHDIEIDNPFYKGDKND